MVRGSRLRQIGWAICIGIVFGGFMLLTFRVNAVKSEVVRAERLIVDLEREKLALETEFETRANQQQLADWNAIEFGYAPPRADQFLETERQLASFSAPRAPGSPAPIRFAGTVELWLLLHWTLLLRATPALRTKIPHKKSEENYTT